MSYKNIMPKNNNGKWHGYIEQYHGNGKLYRKGMYVNGREHGYFEYYNEDGSVSDYYTGYWNGGELISKENEKGYCYIWDKEEL